MKERVIVSLSFFSRSGKSIYNKQDLRGLNSKSVQSYMPDESSIQTVVNILEKKFDIVARTEVGLSMSGEVDKIEDYFHTKIIRQRIKYIKNYEYEEYISEGEIEIPDLLKNYVERVFLQKQFFVLSDNVSGKCPSLDYYHLNVPNDLQRIGHTDLFFNNNCFGNQVKVTLIDTGFYYQHPYFKKMKYDYHVIPVCDWFDPKKDERGHGSGMSSVFLSIAPKSYFTMVKASDQYVSYPLTAFQKAVMIESEVISCSWGTVGMEPQLHLEIANAIRKGSIVVFACGNGTTDRCSALLQTIAQPDVISVGGCYVKPDGMIMASDLSSSYVSAVYENRSCPDVCGICGLKPYGQFILFPSQPASVFDMKNGERDGTKQDDGWFVSSGTSAAAAYVSGMIALCLSYSKNISDIKEVLYHSCNKVTEGVSFMRHKANGEEWNRAVGYGFVDGNKLFNNIKDDSLHPKKGLF